MKQRSATQHPRSGRRALPRRHAPSARAQKRQSPASAGLWMNLAGYWKKRELRKSDKAARSRSGKKAGYVKEATRAKLRPRRAGLARSKQLLFRLRRPAHRRGAPLKARHVPFAKQTAKILLSQVNSAERAVLGGPARAGAWLSCRGQARIAKTFHIPPS